MQVRVRGLAKSVLYSYAKLNLCLAVLGKRKDNYHNIRTVFERIDLADKIELRLRQDKKIKLICEHPDVPQDDKNLAYRSAQLLQDAFGVNRGAEIRIKKCIPVSAGLGGGSSNAATVLLGLNKLWELNLPRDKILNLARKIGSDVPFFIYDVAFAQGLSRGDKIRPLEALKKLRLWHILVVPKIKVSTPLVYKGWDRQVLPSLRGLTRRRYNVKILNLASIKKYPQALDKILFNHLEPVTARLYPEVKRIKRKLQQLGVKRVLMSGSGPGVFGIISSRKEGLFLYKQLKEKNSSWQIFITRTV